MQHFGAWGLIPPILTIVLAFITKDVIISLFLGIFSAAFIVSGANVFNAMLNVIDGIANSLTDGWNIRIFLFCALLGGLVGMLNRTGSARAFGSWVAKHIHHRKSSQIMAVLFGGLIFIDDYFNSLAVGTIMRPICDNQKVPRAKLAYILDSTAAPICIIAPISSWVITVMSIINNSDGFETLNMSSFEFFIRAIPYNLYALMTLIMVILIIVTQRDYGLMAHSEKLAKQGILYNEEFGEAAGEIDTLVTTHNAKAIDMIVPIVILILSAIILFPLTTYRSLIDNTTIFTFNDAVASITLSQAFTDTDASKALFYASIITIVITYIYYVSRRLLNIKTASNSLVDGIKSMVPALIILTLAWTIGTFIKASPEDGGLALSKYLSEIVAQGNFPLLLLPIVIFISSALISFATGTSWGTFAIMIPITMPIATSLASVNNLNIGDYQSIVFIAISAVLGGAVFGDHASPISDTTILSSTGASCPHLEHVATQMPYAITVAIASSIGYLFGGIFDSNIVAWIFGLGFICLSLIFAPKIFNKN